MIEPYTAEELAELRAETTSYLDTEPMYARVGPRTVARLLATIAKREADARRATAEACVKIAMGYSMGPGAGTACDIADEIRTFALLDDAGRCPDCNGTGLNGAEMRCHTCHGLGRKTA